MERRLNPLRVEEVKKFKEEVKSDNEDTWIPGSPPNNENSNAGDSLSSDSYITVRNDEDLDIPRGRRGNPFWTQSVEQVFIERIKSYPPLYDHSNQNWKNTTVKDVIWEEISTEIGIPANECRRHFKHMRDKFVRHKRTGRGSKTWKAGEAMNFLVEMDLIKHRPKNSNEFENELESRTSGETSKVGESSLNGDLNRASFQANLTRSLRLRSRLKRHSTNQYLGHSETGEQSFPSTHPLRQPSNQVKVSNIESNAQVVDIPLAPVIPSPQFLISPIPQGPVQKNENEAQFKAMGSNQGPNFYFGQYIASVLDALPQAESLMTRHKLQEILFEAQRKSNPAPSSIIQFQCTSCSSLFAPI